ncbi:hypothetical protein [Prochlorococcus sp. MIT 1306]|uniref:hypothetical protein n=1 Tax=Prochlorococcus sp. MIT 1306 TaxID=1799667 RepID=UPI0012E7EADF|nr:hypothetical protein [Prochlorococcus sp. MIT 1306]
MGTASMSCPEALPSVAELGLAYAMTSSLACRPSSAGAGHVLGACACAVHSH